MIGLGKFFLCFLGSREVEKSPITSLGELAFVEFQGFFSGLVSTPDVGQRLIGLFEGALDGEEPPGLFTQLFFLTAVILQQFGDLPSHGRELTDVCLLFLLKKADQAL